MTARRKSPDLMSRLIDAAWVLFSTDGYDRTTIESIIEKVGVSKGAFYHYFSGKDEVLNAVVGRMILQSREVARPIVELDTLPAVDKLNRFLAASRKWRVDHAGAVLAVAEVLYRDENIIIRHKADRRMAQEMVPLLSSILKQGNQEGVFNVPEPDETAILILGIMNVMAEIQTKELLQMPQTQECLSLLQRRADLYLQLLERILGAPKGSLRAVDAETFQLMNARVPSHEPSKKGGTHATREDQRP